MRRNHHNDDDRPSLFGDDFALDAVAPVRKGPQPVSMLSGLGTRKARRAPVSWSRWLAGGGFLLVCGITLGVYLQSRIKLDPGKAPSTLNAERAAVRTAGAAAVPPSPSPAPLSPTALQPSSQAAIPLAARLETLPEVAREAAAISEPAPAAAPTPAKDRVPPAGGPALPVAKPLSKADPSAAPSAPAIPTPTASPARAAAAVADGSPGNKRTAAAQPATRDADVDLLAALMSHPNVTPVPTSIPTFAPSSTPTLGAQSSMVPSSVAPPPARLQATAAKRVAPVPVGDKPRVDLSIATLVQDCNGRTNKQEALACRRRICEGYWGKAQACPRELQAPPGQTGALETPAAGRNKT